MGDCYHLQVFCVQIIMFQYKCISEYNLKLWQLRPYSPWSMQLQVKKGLNNIGVLN